MADKVNIPGFKHYELDSTYQAKLAAGEVDPKDLSFVKETGKLYTQGGEYGGGGDIPIEILQVGVNLTDDQKAHNVNIYNKLRNNEKILVASLDLFADGHYCIFSHISWLLNDSNNEVVGITLNQPIILEKALYTEKLYISKAEVNLYPDGSVSFEALEKNLSAGDDVEARILHVPKEGLSLTQKQIDYNVETYNKLMQGDAILVYLSEWSNYPLAALNFDSVIDTAIILRSPLYVNPGELTHPTFILNNDGSTTFTIETYPIGITIDTELSDTSENAVQNKVVTAAINGIDTRVQEIEGFFDEGAKLNLTIKSNQGTDSTISAVKATIEYDGQSVQAGSGVIGLPVFTDIKITFPDVEGYKTPAPLEFNTGAVPIVYEVTYETELVNVTVTAWDGTSVVGQIITINGTQYTWNGTTIQHKVPFGTEYKVSGNSKDGYMEPEETFTASLATRNVGALYSAMVGSWITLNQTITDPATMISGDVNGEHIQLIRNNSHRYLGKYTADGTMTVCQLDDTNSNLYADGSVATLTGTEGDVFMKLPKFYYMAKERQTDVWSIGFYYGDSAPSSAWKEWDGNDLIGVYKATVSGSKAYSVSGKMPTTTTPQVSWKNYVANRGNGFTMHKFRYNSMLAMLFYASYGNLNAQAVIGLGPVSTNSLTIGSTNDLGMEDTAAGINGDDTTNFLGLECLWSACGEYVCDLEQVYDTKVKLQLTIDGVPYIYDTKFNGYILKMAIGENLALIPTEIGGTATTGYCDYITGPTTSGQVPAVGGSGNVLYGAASLNFIAPNSYTRTDATRLCFRGNIIINNDSTAFKALTAIG